MKVKLCDASIEEIKLTTTLKYDTLNNIFNYYGYPINNASSIEVFKSCLEESARDHVNSYENEEDYYKELVETKILTNNNIEYVICYIKSYNLNEAFIKTSRLAPSTPITNIELLALYSLAYQYMYKEEEITAGGDPGHLPGMLNRAESNGRYKIWGHDIGNLCYNGFSEVKIYSNFIMCNFSVDS